MEACNYVGPGWAPIVDKAIDEIEFLGIKVVQVKEKFGSLRIYTHPYSIEAETIVEAAENATRNICEECGNPGKNTNRRGWMKTVCEEHAK